MKIQTLEDALALVPKYILLEPGDITRKKDEWFYAPRGKWEKIPIGYLKNKVIALGSDGLPCRRPVPKSVRLAEARWLLFKELRFTHYPSSQVKVFSTRSQDNGVLICTDCAWGLFPVDIEKLGSAAEINKILAKGPGALMRFIQEGREW